MHNIGAEKSRMREMAGGLPYVYPPKSKRDNLLETPKAVVEARMNIDKDHLEDSFSRHYQYLSKALMSEIIKSGEIEKNLKIALKFENTNPSVAADYSDFSAFSFIENERNFKSTINEMLDDYFSFYMEKTVIVSLKQSLLAFATKELKKNQSALEKQQFQADRLEKALIQRRKADIIMANLYQLKRGTAKITLSDFETGEPVEIDMDEAQTPVENANRYYKLYNKAKTAFEVATNMMKQTFSRIEYFENIIFQIETAENFDNLLEIEEEIMPKTQKAKKQAVPIVEEVEINGFRVFIGKNNKQNDYIFSKISSPEDIWFHAQNSPGAHILVKLGDKKEIDDETLLKAAQIAKKYSKQADAVKAPVIYTKRKYLKRPPNTPAGYVTYKCEQEITVTD